MALKTIPQRMMHWIDSGLQTPSGAPQVIAADGAQHNVASISTSITKRYADTDLMIELEGTAFSPNTGWAAVFGVLVNAVDTACCQCFFNVANQHMTFAGGCRLTGLPPGTYTIQLRFKSTAVAVANLNLDSTDRWRIRCDEGWS